MVGGFRSIEVRLPNCAIPDSNPARILSDMGHCYTHGDHRGNICPECRAKELDEQHEELVQAIGSLSDNEVDYDSLADKLADKLNNPGDWSCPWCQHYTLLYRAWRCPKCHAQFSPEYYDQYWTEVDEEIEEEKKEKQREEEERQRQRAEAARKAQAEAEAAQSSAESCFVATVCFGDRSAPEVVCLQKWRDRTLHRFRLGRGFIRMYYSGFGAGCANWIADKPKFKNMVRKTLKIFVHWEGLISKHRQ